MVLSDKYLEALPHDAVIFRYKALSDILFAVSNTLKRHHALYILPTSSSRGEVAERLNASGLQELPLRRGETAEVRGFESSPLHNLP
jgi:hypothetical protein